MDAPALTRQRLSLNYLPEILLVSFARCYRVRRLESRFSLSGVIEFPRDKIDERIAPRRILLKIRFPDYDPRGINCAITREQNGKRDMPLSNSDVLVASLTSLRETARGETRFVIADRPMTRDRLFKRHVRLLLWRFGY